MLNLVHTDSETLVEKLTHENRVKKFLDPLHDHHLSSYEHSIRVALLAIDLGKDCHLSPEEQELLGLGGLLHDLGKRLIPNYILDKPGKPDTTEMHMLRQHPCLGFMMLKQFEDPRIKWFTLTHHEFSDKPYPHTWEEEGNALPKQERNMFAHLKPLAQIIAAADVADALTSPRAYRKMLLSHQEVEDIFSHQYTGNRMYATNVLRKVA